MIFHMYPKFYFSFMAHHQTKPFLIVLLKTPVYFLHQKASKKAIPTNAIINVVPIISQTTLQTKELSFATFVMKNLNTTTFFGYIIVFIFQKNNAYYVPFVPL